MSNKQNRKKATKNNSTLGKKRAAALTRFRQRSNYLVQQVNNKIQPYSSKHMLEELFNFENGL